MKKDKSKKQAPAEFNNNPFKSLKAFKPVTDPARQKAPVTRKDTREQQDDAELFLRAMSGARSIHDTAEAPSPLKKARVPAQEAPEDQELFLQSMQRLGATLRMPQVEEDGDDEPRQSASSRVKQLKRGTIQISEELDLHGCVRDEALQKLSRFVSGAYSRGRKAVLVITGKGINSPDGPVLQGAVDDWLRTKGKGLVAEFVPAPRDKGGSGAFVVFLKAKER